jgi:uncharacterized membrane protein
MGLSPKEKRRIYEEEKAKIEAQEQKEKGKQRAKGESTTSLKPNVAGLLCYLGFWVTGIIFLFIERKNRLVRFHAMQSLVTFGILNIIWGIANTFRGWGLVWSWGLRGFWGPQYIAATAIFIIFFVLWWVFWAIGMYKAYHGTPFRLPWFSNLAEKCLAKLDAKK